MRTEDPRMTAGSAEIEVFGRGAFSHAGVRSPIARDVFATLAYLALAPGSVARTAMFADVWPESDLATAQQRLRRAVHTFERAIETAMPLHGRAFVSERATIALSEDTRACIDVVRFRRLAAEPNTAERAVELYRSNFAEELEGSWVVRARSELAREFRAALERASVVSEARCDISAALNYVRTLRAGAELDERLVCEEMRLLALSGARIDALETYRTFARAMRANYDAEPSLETRERYERLRRGESSRRRSLPAPTTTFFGRARELAAIETALESHRLVSLVGLAHAGKSRLALHAAARFDARFTDGAVAIDASRIQTYDEAAAAVATALERERTPNGRAELSPSSLHSLLDERDVLIVLDGVDALRDRARFVNDILVANAHIRILVTARASFGFSAERVITVGPLDREAALDLLAARAHDRAPDIRDEGDRASAARRIVAVAWCLPGLIERAALRLRSTNVTDLANVVERDPGYLWPPLDEIFEALSPFARAAFSDLSIFPAGWSLSGAAAVCSPIVPDERALRDVIAELTDRSLIVLSTAAEGEQRYELVPPLRILCLETVSAQQRAVARNRMLAYYVERFAALAEELNGTHADANYAWIADDLPNIRAVLRAAIDERLDVDGGVRIVIALARFAIDNGHSRELDAWLQTALRDDGLEDSTRSDAREASAGFALHVGDFERSYRHLLAVAPKREGRALAKVHNSLAVAARSLGNHEESLAFARQARDGFALLGDHANTGRANSSIATTLLVLDRVDESRRAFEDARICYEIAGAKLDMVHTLVNAAVSSYFAGDLDAARSYNDRALDIATSGALVYVEALARNNAALFDVAEGAVRSALEHSKTGLTLCNRIGDPEAIANSIAAAAFTLLYGGDAESSAFGLGASQAELERLGTSRIPVEDRFIANWMTRLLAALGRTRREALLAEGRASRPEDAGFRILAALDRAAAEGRAS